MNVIFLLYSNEVASVDCPAEKLAKPESKRRPLAMQLLFWGNTLPRGACR